MLTDDLVAAADTFATAKRAYTAQLTAMAAKLNAGQPVTNADWADLIVNRYDPMTASSNALRALIATYATTRDISLQNLTDTQVEEMRANPQQYFAAGYLAIVNSLLFYPRATGLTIADMVLADLKQDINDAWDDNESGVIPDTPRTAIVFSNAHALDLVNKALDDVLLPVEAAA